MNNGEALNELQPCLINIDKDGYWFHKGAKIIRRDYIRSFFQNMELDTRGRYVLTWQGKQCFLDVEDTAFVVWNISFRNAKEHSVERVELSLSDDAGEDLAPETLFVGKDNVLYCRVKNGAFPARFSRAAYYSLAARIEEGQDGFFLLLNNEKYIIHGA